MKDTLRSKVIDQVCPYLDPNGVIAPGTYGDSIKSIHTDVVRDSISRQAKFQAIKRLPSEGSSS